MAKTSKINEQGRFLIYAAFIEAHLALILSAVAFGTSYWLTGKTIQAGGDNTPYHLGLFKSGEDGKETDTKTFMEDHDFGGKYREVHMTIVMEGISLSLTAIAVFVLYIVVFKRKVGAFWTASFCLAIGGILSMSAPGHLFGIKVPDLMPVESFGYSGALCLVSGAIALAGSFSIALDFLLRKIKRSPRKGALQVNEM